MTDPTAVATAASVAASSQNMQIQQQQLLSQMTQMINSANLSCAKGTDCYKKQQITDAQNEYNAAVIKEKNAPKVVDTTLKTFLVASKGQNGANQALMSRYEKNGDAEKAKLTQQFDDWFNDMTKKIDTTSQHAQTSTTMLTSNKLATTQLKEIAVQNDDTTNELNLLERKTHYTAQNVKMINGIEYYFKLLYWLAFLTWLACIIYERAFTMKTAGLFVLFTVIILMQNLIIDTVSSSF
jgi:glucan-binding YG repeat protein